MSGEEAAAAVEDWAGRISTTIVEGLRHCFDMGAFTDIEIEVGDNVFRCHKVFLSAISDYFLAMFTSGMKECEDARVTIRDLSLSGPTFRAVLDFYYSCDRSVITSDTAQDLLRASGLLQMNTLQDSCEAWYAEHLNQSNALEIWTMAENLQCESLALKAKEFVLLHFMTMCSSLEFLQMDVDHLKELLSDDELRVPDEDYVVQVVLTWIKHNLESRVKCLTEIRAQLRERFISDEGLGQILEFIQSEGHNNDEVHSVCNDVDIESPQIHSRHYENMLVVIGMHGATWNQRGIVHAYSFNTKTWFILCSLRMDPGEGYASCVLDNKLYLSGVNLRSPFFMTYDPDGNVWEERCEMPQRRRYHEMIVVKDQIYGVCGCNQVEGVFSSVLHYDTDRNTWSNVGQLQKGVYSASSCAVNHTIYIFGGRTHGDDSTTLRDIQAFHVNTGTSSVINRFPSPVAESRCLAINSSMYVILTNGFVMKVDPSGEFKRHCVLPNFDRFNFGLVQRNSNLLVLGGDTRYPSEHGPFIDMSEVSGRTGQVRELDDSLLKKGKAAGCRILLLRRKVLPQLNIPGRPGSFRRHSSGRSAPGVSR